MKTTSIRLFVVAGLLGILITGVWQSHNGAWDTGYKNTVYGFSLPLPETWKGYSVIQDDWRGHTTNSTIPEGAPEDTGPLILLRHPAWSEEDKRQDIPIMIFTIRQWNRLQSGDFHMGAAPMNPSELGRNAEWVFALPARYNYAFETGYEEVDDILRNNVLQTFEPKSG